MARSPWARLTNRMTPNDSDSPVANNEQPTEQHPCTAAFAQLTPRTSGTVVSSPLRR